MLAEGNATLCATDFARLGRQVGVDSVMHEWLFAAFDLNDDRILSFKDWVLCVERTTRSTCRDLAAVALRVLGEDENQARARAPAILARQGVALGDAEVEDEVRALAIAYESTDQLDFRVMSLKLVQVSVHSTRSVGVFSSLCAPSQACCDLVLDFFAPHTLEMEAKLKRAPPLSVTLVCRKERVTVPVGVRILCERLQAIELTEKRKCVDFAPDSLYVHRTTVEAVANAFALGFVVVDGLGADVLLMVLRTYLRHFTEPLWTLHVCKHLMHAAPALQTPARLALLAQTIPALPATHRQTTHLLLQTAAMLAHDDVALDTLTRILAYVLIRNEAKATSTGPLSIDLVKLAISHFGELDPYFVL